MTKFKQELNHFLGNHHPYESGITTLISHELSEGKWHQLLTFESDTSIDINLELV